MNYMSQQPCINNMQSSCFKDGNNVLDAPGGQCDSDVLRDSLVSGINLRNDVDVLVYPEFWVNYQKSIGIVDKIRDLYQGLRTEFIEYMNLR